MASAARTAFPFLLAASLVTNAVGLSLTPWSRSPRHHLDLGNLLITVGLSNDEEVVLIEEPSGSWSPHLQRTQNTVATKKLHAFTLLDNWLSFLPQSLLPQVLVLCLDDASVQYAELRGLKTYRCSTRLSPFRHKRASGLVDWSWRAKAIEHLFQEGRDVLLADLDAPWLGDPLPVLARAVQRFSPDAIALRGIENFHTLNCGFMLLRNSFYRFGKLKLWLDDMEAVDHDDQYSFNRVFPPKDASGWEQTPDGYTVAKAERLVILPSHQFTRVHHLVRPGCRPNKVINADKDLNGHVYCVDKQVVVLHQRGEVLRALERSEWKYPSDFGVGPLAHTTVRYNVKPRLGSKQDDDDDNQPTDVDDWL